MRQFAPVLSAGMFGVAAATAPFFVLPQAHAAGQLLDPGWQVVGQPAPAANAGRGLIEYIFSDSPGELAVAPVNQPPPVVYYQPVPASRRRGGQAPLNYQAAPQPAAVYYQSAPAPAADYQPSNYQPVPPPQAPMLSPRQPLYQQAPPLGYQQVEVPPPGYQQAPPPGYQQVEVPPPGYQQAPPPGYRQAPPPGYQQGYQQVVAPEPAPQYAGQPVPPPQAPAYQPQQPEQQQLAFQGSAGAGAVYNMAHQPINPIYERQLVTYQGNEKPGTILIDTPHFFLYLVLDGGRAIRYGIGVGRPGFTWAGVKQISAKREWPDWIPPVEMLQRRPDLPRRMSGGPNNPLGARAMYLGSTLYRIHGSNEPWSIGTQVSSGCIRLRNEDVIDLYDRVKLGAKVVVM